MTFWRKFQAWLNTPVEPIIPASRVQRPKEAAPVPERVMHAPHHRLMVEAAPQPWMPIAWSYNGQKETKGKLHNALIVELFALSGHPQIKDDETAWCAAFVGGVMARAGSRGTGKLSARSYDAWGTPLTEPIYGCVGVKRRSDPKAPSWQGHLGFVVGANAKTIYLLGGNQNDGVSVAGFKRDEFTAFVYPPGFALPKEAPPLPTTLAKAGKNVREA